MQNIGVSFDVRFVSYHDTQKMSQGGSKWMSQWSFDHFSIEMAQKILSTTLSSNYNEYQEALSKLKSNNSKSLEIQENTHRTALTALKFAHPESLPKVFNLKIEQEPENLLPVCKHISIRLNNDSEKEYQEGLDLQMALTRLTSFI